jgi:PAS domain S-box-containing protein
MVNLMPGKIRHSHAVILHVEDDPATRYATSRVLQREGFTVTEATTGEEGLKLLEQRPDLVILDVNLPDLNGFEVCRRIKANPATATVPVLHLSASHVTDEAQARGLETGADGYLVQPVDPDVLVATVKALLRLRRAEEEYRSIFENAVEGIFQTTVDGRLAMANPALARMFGYDSPEEMMDVSDIGRHFYADPEQHAEFARLMQDHGSVSGFEARGRCKDGSAIWVSLNARALYGGGDVVGYEGTVEDVTERRQAEEELRARANQQAVVSQLGQKALAETDLQVLMDEVTALAADTLWVEYCKVLELLPDGEKLLLRAGVGWKEGLVGRATMGAGLNSQAGYALLSDEPVIVEDLRAEERFSGPPLLHEHGVVSGMSAIIHGRGGPFGVLGAHTKERREFTGDDVNFLQAVANVLGTAVQRKESEEQLREVREAERHRLARDLHDEALQDLTRALVETQLLQEICEGPKLNQGLERVGEALKRAAQGMHGAIYDLRLEGEARERTLVEMLKSLVELNRRGSPPGCQIALFVEEDFSPRLPEEKRVELVRMVREALTNVGRHSEARRVRVAVGTSGSKLWAEVTDDGRGFDPQEIPVGTGTKGMRERARLMGGDLKIVSKPGEGTKVRFELALKKVGEAPEEEVRILLVEDHSSVRQAMASLFEREQGFRVVGQAGSLSGARQMLDGVDVAIIDLGLPDGYGGELIKELRGSNPQAQALVLSAFLDHAEIARAVESGAAGVLHKLVEMDEVVEAVRRLRAGDTLLPLEEIVELLRFAGSHREEEYEARQAVGRLTSREEEVLQALAEGLDSREIAERLHISLKTEANHMTSVLNKLGVHSRVQALVFAVRHGAVKIH